jgi:hypothetical protein
VAAASLGRVMLSRAALSHLSFEPKCVWIVFSLGKSERDRLYIRSSMTVGRRPSRPVNKLSSAFSAVLDLVWMRPFCELLIPMTKRIFVGISVVLVVVPLAFIIPLSWKASNVQRNETAFADLRRAVEACSANRERDLRCEALIRFWQLCRTAEDGCAVEDAREVLQALGF